MANVDCIRHWHWVRVLSSQLLLGCFVSCFFDSYVMDLAFLKVPDSSGIEGLNWRLMLGSAGVPAIILAGKTFASHPQFAHRSD